MLCMSTSGSGGEEAPVRAIGFGVAQFWGSKAQGRPPPLIQWRVYGEVALVTSQVLSHPVASFTL